MKYFVGDRVVLTRDFSYDPRMIRGKILTLKKRGEFVPAAPGYTWDMEEDVPAGINECFFTFYESELSVRRQLGRLLKAKL